MCTVSSKCIAAAWWDDMSDIAAQSRAVVCCVDGLLQVVPQYTVFSGMLPHIAHLKLKPGVAPSFFMHDELKMVRFSLSVSL